MQFIALCGYPKSGKTEVQQIISQRYGFAACDDSRPLRDAAKILYGLTDWHVSTQDGKSSILPLAHPDAAPITVRQALGDLGCYLESRDEFHFPRLAVQTCLTDNPEGRFVFASVRRNQSAFYKQAGEALVIEVTREGCHPSAEFDDYIRDTIDLSIENHFDQTYPERSRRRLEADIAAMLDPILGRSLAA